MNFIGDYFRRKTNNKKRKKKKKLNKNSQVLTIYKSKRLAKLTNFVFLEDYIHKYLKKMEYGL